MVRCHCGLNHCDVAPVREKFKWIVASCVCVKSDMGYKDTGMSWNRFLGEQMDVGTTVQDGLGAIKIYGSVQTMKAASKFCILLATRL